MLPTNDTDGDVYCIMKSIKNEMKAGKIFTDTDILDHVYTYENCAEN